MLGTLLYTPHVRMEPTTVQRAGLDVIAQAQFSAQVIEILSNTPDIDCIITDHTDAVFVERITQDFPGLPVLIIATHPSIQAAVRLLNAGAAYYLSVEDVNIDTLSAAAQQAQRHRHRHHERHANLLQALNLLNAAVGGQPTPYANAPPGHAGSTSPPTTPDHDAGRLSVRGVELDTYQHEVSYRGNHIDLSPTEFDILHTLMLASGQLVSFVDLARAIHGTDVDQAQARSLLSAHISNLRNKLRDVGCENYIINRRGRGYFIDTDVESALERGGNELRLILEASNDIILQVDADATIEYMSQSIQHTLGYATDQFIGTTIDDWVKLVHPADHAKVRILLHHLEMGRVLEQTYRVRHRDGRYVWLENIANPTYVNDQLAGMVMVLRDVTERVQFMQQLSESEDRLRLLLENVPDLIVTVDVVGVVRYSNMHHENIRFLKQGELVGQALEDVFSSEIRDDIRSNIEHAYQQGAYFEHELYWQHDDDEEGWLHVRYCPVLAGDSVADLMLIIHDATQEKRAVQTIRENAERYRVLAEHMTDLVSMHDTNANFTYLSPSSERLLGYTPAELTDADVYHLLHPKDVANFRERAHLPALHGHQIHDHVCRMRRKDGQYIWVEISMQPVLNEHNAVVYLVATSRDMTYRSRVQAPPLRAHRSGPQGFAPTSSEVS